MAAHRIDVAYVADLARLALGPDERARFEGQLDHVVTHVEQLQRLDVEGIEPTAHAAPVVNVWRADAVRPSLDPREALRNAPQQANNLVIMPKIVE